MIKKIAASLVLVSLVLAMGSLAAVKPAAPAVKPAISAPAPVVSSANKMALGVYSFGSPIASAAGMQLGILMPTISYRFTESFVGDASLTYGSAGSSNAFGLTLRGDYDLGTGKVRPHIGGLLGFISGSVAGASASSISVGLCWGVTADVTDDFAVTADLYPVTFYSPSGSFGTTSTFALLSGALAARYWF